LRGEVLLRRDPANLEPAEEAFETSISVARNQGARSYVPLVLAKLYQSTACPAKVEARRLLETGDRVTIRDAIVGSARPDGDRGIEAVAGR
jgi:hypothetical protein